MESYCSNCGNKIEQGIVFCPKCGKQVNHTPIINTYENVETRKQTPVWRIVLGTFLIIIGAIWALSGFLEFAGVGVLKKEKSDNIKNIEYQSVTVDELENELENNAAAAKEKYNGKYLEIKGRLDVIDSDLKYIGIYSLENKWGLIGIHCTLKNYTIKEKVKTLTSGQTVLVRGKITDVGEVLGYYVDAYEIISQ